MLFGSHACSIQTNMHVTNSIPLGPSLSYRCTLVICVETLKGYGADPTAGAANHEYNSLGFRVNRPTYGSAFVPMYGAPTLHHHHTPLTCVLALHRFPCR